MAAPSTLFLLTENTIYWHVRLQHILRIHTLLSSPTSPEPRPRISLPVWRPQSHLLSTDATHSLPLAKPVPLVVRSSVGERTAIYSGIPVNSLKSNLEPVSLSLSNILSLSKLCRLPLSVSLKPIPSFQQPLTSLARVCIISNVLVPPPFHPSSVLYRSNLSNVQK